MLGIGWAGITPHRDTTVRLLDSSLIAGRAWGDVVCPFGAPHTSASHYGTVNGTAEHLTAGHWPCSSVMTLHADREINSGRAERWRLHSAPFRGARTHEGRGAASVEPYSRYGLKEDGRSYGHAAWVPRTLRADRGIERGKALYSPGRCRICLLSVVKVPDPRSSGQWD